MLCVALFGVRGYKTITGSIIVSRAARLSPSLPPLSRPHSVAQIMSRVRYPISHPCSVFTSPPGTVLEGVQARRRRWRW